jgi:hypothetical protein
MFEKRRRERDIHRRNVDQASKQVLAELGRTAGDASEPGVRHAIQELEAICGKSSFDPRKLTVGRDDMMLSPAVNQLEDTWISLTKAEFKDCLGTNEGGDCLYTLGRMSFGKGTSVSCAFYDKANFNSHYF